MSRTDEQLREVFSKSNGCYYCEAGLVFDEYGMFDAEGYWGLDHRIPLSRGGSTGLRNLVAACVRCLQEKGYSTSAEFIRSDYVQVERERQRHNKRASKSEPVVDFLDVLLHQ